MNKDFLPQGDSIRQLLIKSNVTKHNINLLLREKGVFLGHLEKNNSVPLLMKSIISPNDFENLYSTQKTKEDSIKYRTTSVICNKDFDIKEVLSGKFNLNDSITEIHTYKPNYKVLGDANFYFEDENTSVLKYRIERENLLNDWSNNKTYHEGSVIVKKTNNNSIQLTIQNNSTSKETKDVNNIIVNKIKETLKINSYINNQNDFVSIKFNDFDNKNRIKFLNSFASNCNVYSEFISTTDIDIFLDETVSSHSDIKNFVKELDNLKLNGKELNNHMILSQEKYYDKLIFGAIKQKYKLIDSQMDGYIILTLSFPEYVKNKNENSELQITIDLSIKKEDRNSKTENSIRKKLLNALEQFKIEKYNNLKK